MLRLTGIILVSLVLSSCVTDEPTNVNAPKSTEDRIGGAVATPLTDLNIVQTAIPHVLEEAEKNPYAEPENANCEGLIVQVELLNKALGPDLDAMTNDDKKTYIDKGGEFAENEAVGSVERTVQGVIPFRSWIRRLSGAEKRSNELKAAIAAGVVRRAFLKGMGLQQGCIAPASPIKHPDPEPEKKDEQEKK